MKVFISWSGEDSHIIALKLRDVFEATLQFVEPFISSEDIEFGSNWLTILDQQLNTTSFGILCLTKNNLNAPWLLFEAGAISKGAGATRVIPLLLGVESKDIDAPLSKLHAATKADRDSLFKLFSQINGHGGDIAIPDRALRTLFDKFWPEIEAAISKTIEKSNEKNPDPLPVKPTEEYLDEILGLCRKISRNMVRPPRGLEDYERIMKQTIPTNPLFALMGDRSVEGRLGTGTILEAKRQLAEDAEKIENAIDNIVGNENLLVKVKAAAG